MNRSLQRTLATVILIPIMTPIAFPQPMQSLKLAEELFSTYEAYSLKQIVSRRFTQSAMVEWIEPFVRSGIVEKAAVGRSAEGRTIYAFSFGKGTTRVLAWSQMHGDESTATMALLDFFSFVAQNRSHPAVKTITDNLTLLIVPMLNPDGAERFQRRTAQLIDMNRDALALGTPEARILKTLHERYRPEYAFNLHDQDPRYTVGLSKKVAAISLLAPATDEAKSDPPHRMRAKRLASLFAEVMHRFVPGHVARYDDTFEPRAFGDNVQKWGSSTILVESGGWPNDPEKFFLRKLNFVGLVSSFYALATREIEGADIAPYESLPFNMMGMFDIVIRNVLFKASDTVPALRVDIGINYEEQQNDSLGHRTIARITDLGDLSTFIAYEEIDGSAMTLDGSQVGIDRILSLEELHVLLRR